MASLSYSNPRVARFPFPTTNSHIDTTSRLNENQRRLRETMENAETEKTPIPSDAPDRNDSIWIVIPAYNEATVIGSVIKDIRTAGYHNILVVDDGSKDETGEHARREGAEVLRHLINRGQGAALRSGLSFIAKTYNPDIIVTFDADGQHRAKDIDALVQPIREDLADITLGSRFLDSERNIPFLREMILRCAILFTNIVSHIRLTDTHNGFRAFNRKAYRAIKIFHRGMEHASDIIDEISKNNLRYCEVPVKITYSDYSIGKGQRTSSFLKMGVRILLKKIL